MRIEIENKMKIKWEKWNESVKIESKGEVIIWTEC